MGSQVLDAATAEALDRLAAAVDALLVAGVEPVDAHDASVVVLEVEVQALELPVSTEPWQLHNPGNGGPACGRHNRHKHGFATGRGYTVHRDPTGQWHTHRPDGTEIH